MSKKAKVSAEPRKVQRSEVTDAHLEWMKLTAELNAGGGNSTLWQKDIYSCLCELQELRSKKVTVAIDFETHVTPFYKQQ